MRTLPPQRLTDSTWAGIEKQLKWIFFELVFAPILVIVDENTAQKIELRNAAGLSALIGALRSGRVQYQRGLFSGNFNVSISNDIRSFGGTFDSRTSTFSADIGKIPGAIKAEAAQYASKAKAVHEELKAKLIEIQDRLDDRLAEYNVNPYGAMEKIEGGFRKSAEALKIQPHLDDARAKQLALDYNKSIKLPIKDFAQQSINTLREAVEDNAMQGYRFDRLKDVIKHRYGVTASKAKFLARQETSLFMSKYRQQRFAQAGVKNYKWSTAHDERVRDSHKNLNGRIFSYDSPPITDRRSGARNNPGEDFNCRCLDIPLLDKIVEFV